MKEYTTQDKALTFYIAEAASSQSNRYSVNKLDNTTGNWHTMRSQLPLNKAQKYLAKVKESYEYEDID